MERIKRAKGISIVLLFMMVFQLMMPVNFAYGDTTEEQVQAFSNDNFTPYDVPIGTALTASAINVRDVKFGIIGDDGIGEIDDEYLLELGVDELVETFYLEFKFNLDGGHTFKGGDYYEFNVPAAFDIKVETDKPVISGGETIATYSISADGTVRITFTDVINDGTPIYNGLFSKSWLLGNNVKNDLLTQEYPFNINGDKNFKIIVSNNSTESINKHNGIHDKNEPTVEWYVDVNKETKDIGGKELNDSMKDQIVPGTIKVYELIPKLQNGNIIFEQSSTDTSEGFTLTDNTFPITFVSGNKKAYRVYYETTITDAQRESVFNDTSNKISNTASLGTATDSGEATISFDMPITKTASDYNSTTGKIQWTVVVNSDERDISGGIKIVDTLTKNVSTGNESADGNYMKFVKDGTDNVIVNITPAPKPTPSITLSGADSNVLTIYFEPTEDNKTAPHTITYETKDDVVDRSYTVSNEAELSYTLDDNTYSDGVEVNVSPNMISKSGETGGNIDYEKKEIEWWFTFNGSGYTDITNVTINDTFEPGKYLKMYKQDFINANPERFRITDGGTVTDEPYFTISLKNEKPADEKGVFTLEGFILTLHGTIGIPVTFRYPTTFDPTIPYVNNNIQNNIGVNWMKDGTNYSNSGSFTSTFNKFTEFNGDKTGIYNPIDKTVEWKVDINYNMHTLNNARVVDTFGHKQTMSEITTNTIKVYLLHMNDGENPTVVLPPYTNYTVTPTGISGEYIGFELGFNEPINRPYRIVYTTEYKEQWIGEFNDSTNKARNKATLYDGGTKKSELDTEDLNKSPNIPNAGKYISKDGRDISNKDYLEWKLKVNESQSYIQEGSTISDTLNEGQILLENFTGITLDGQISAGRGMFEIKRRVYTRNGDNFTSQLVLLNQNEVDEIFDFQVAADKRSFTITLLQDIEHEYQISYVTDISASAESTLSNTYTYSFNGAEKVDTVTQTRTNVSYEWGGVSGELRFYNLELTKRDGSTPLQNAKFGLYKTDGVTLVKEATSNASGKVDFGKVKWGTFILKEIVPPAGGYTTEFRIGSTGGFVSEYLLHAKGTEQSIKIDIYNELPGKIIVNKYDSVGDYDDPTIKLEGAEFEIKNSNGDIVDTIASDEDGYASSKDLPPGTYTITEIKAPYGYVRVTSSKTVTVESNKNVTADFANDKIYQAIELIKVDADDSNEKLVGAVFELYDADDNLVAKDKDGNDLPVSFTTDGNGRIFIDNLESGTYKLIEKSAPIGYWLDKIPVEFIIVENQIAATSHTVSNTKTGELKIKKVDYANNANLLPGAVFELYDAADTNFEDPLFTSSASGADGIATFTGVKYGSYILKEKQAPIGYIVNPSDDGIMVEINSLSKEITVENELIYQAVRLTKIDAEKNEVKLQGAKFTLHHSDGTPVTHNKNGVELPDVFITNEDGEIAVNNLSHGSYYFMEIDAPKYYLLPDEESQRKVEFTIIENQIAFANVTAKNTRGMGSIIITKVDSADNNILLDGVVFDITNNSGTVTRRGTTADGKVEFTALPYDTYTITEVEAHIDYVANVLPTVAILDGDTNGIVIDRTIENIKKDYSVELTKYNVDKSLKLSGAIFELRMEVDGDYVVVDKFSLEDLTTDEDGVINLKDLEVGKYQLIEKEAPDGYVLNSDPVEFEIEENQTSPTEVEKLNSKKPTGGGGGTTPTPVYGSVAVKKVDEDRKVLSGAEFTLYDSNGKVVGKAVTGSDGTVSFEELEPGEYVLKETKSPDGYVLDDKETDVTISANKTSSYTFTNRKEEPKKPGRIEIIKTDEEGRLLSDAWFSLIDENGSTLQNAGTVNGRVAFEDVLVGRYTVKEVQAPEGYELSSKEVTVTVESNKTVELSFVNKKSGTLVVPANGRISITKVDENSNALAGAEFTLYDENNRIVETAVSDRNGNVVFENLKDGRYFVKETKAPEGYVLVNEAKIVDIAGGQTYSYRFKNVPESVLIEDPDVPMGWETIDEPDVPKGVGTLPNTGYILNTWMLAALGLLLIAEGLFLRKRRKITN